MFFNFDHKSIKLIGRWYKKTDSAVTTTAGSRIKFAFQGKMAVMHFDVSSNQHPYPHLWVRVDNGAKVEVPLERFVRIDTETSDVHMVEVIYKGGVEIHPRWNEPLVGKISFCGYEADEDAVLYDSPQKIIEFVGDSITEGVLIDADYNPNEDDQNNRIYQDDVTATYAYLTAQNLDLCPVFMGYGGTGLTHGGCGNVPKAIEAYPYCYHNAPAEYVADYIVINYGANDRRANAQEYLTEYEQFLILVRKLNPCAKIIVLSTFCGAFADELQSFIPEYNRNHNEEILFINSKSWISPEPLHPLRQGHKIVAEHLTQILRQRLKTKIKPT